MLDGLRGETSIAELCRREGIAESMYLSGSESQILLRHHQNQDLGSDRIGSGVHAGAHTQKNGPMDLFRGPPAPLLAGLPVHLLRVGWGVIPRQWRAAIAPLWGISIRRRWSSGSTTVMMSRLNLDETSKTNVERPPKPSSAITPRTSVHRGALRGEKGSDEGKVFNLVRGLQKEIDDDPNAAAVLQPLKDRAERILKDLEDRKTTGLAAMDLLAALAAEKDAAAKAAKETGLSLKAFGVFWALRQDAALKSAGIVPLDLAKETEKLLIRFPNARVNADEQRQLRAALYRPLLAIGRDERTRIVDLVMEIVTQ